MYVKNDNFLIKFSINFGNLLKCERDEDASIMLREPRTKDTIKIEDSKNKGTEQLFATFKEIVPSLFIDHTFFKTESEKMTPEEVIELLFERTDLTIRLLEEYTKNVNFTSAPKTERK